MAQLTKTIAIAGLTIFCFSCSDGKPKSTIEPTTPTAVTPPSDPICQKKTSGVTQEMFLVCFPDGIGFVEMSNIIGWAGKPVSQSGDTIIYQWGDGGDQGVLTAAFRGNRLISKSQSGLPSEKP